MSLRRLPLPDFPFAAAAAVGALFPIAVPARAGAPELPPCVRTADIADAAHVRDLIRQLAKMDNADFGVTSYTLEDYGMAFAPDHAPDSQQPSFRLPDERRERFPAFVELVRLGPRALPYLLQAMDDPTPTRLQIWHGDASFMSMVVSPGNRANARETKIFAEQCEAHRCAVNAAIKAGLLFRPDQMTMRNPDFVTIGDICITAIGQITGRDYPKQTAAMIAARLNGLHVGATGSDESSPAVERQRDANQVDAVQFIEMVSDGKWDREFLATLLTDRRATTWTQPITSKRTLPEKRMRLCDIAAKVICWHRGQTVFPSPGAENDLDPFERHLQATLAAEKN